MLPAVNLALLMPGADGQRPLPTLPLVGASFALGYGAVGPYLALREPRPAPLRRSELPWLARYVTESRPYAAGLSVAALALLGGLLTMSQPADAVADFAELFATSKLVHVSTIDFGILSAFAYEPIREDMCRRGWWDDEKPLADNDVTRLAAFCVPLLGPAIYLLVRPSLDE